MGGAAFKNVGTTGEDLVEAKNSYKATFNKRDNYYNGNANVNANDFETGTRHLVLSSNANMPPVSDFYLVETLYNYSDSTKLQKAWGYNKTSMFIRALNGAGKWSPWKETVFTGSAAKFESIEVGLGSPRIAYKKLTGTFRSDTNTLIPHGMAVGKILDAKVSVLRSTSTTVPPNNPSEGLHYTYYWTDNDITLRPINASVLEGAPVVVLITYEV